MGEHRRRGHRADEDFDHYVVDTRRAQRWTESRRRATPAGGDGAGRRRDGYDRREGAYADHRAHGDEPDAAYDDGRSPRYDAVGPEGTRAMPTASPLPPLPRAGDTGTGRREPTAPRRTTAPTGSTRSASAPRAPRRQGPPPGTRVTSGPAPAGRPRRRIRWRRLLPLLLVAWIAFLVVTPLLAWTSVHRADTDPTGTRPTTAGGHNYLLLGSDSRVDMSASEREKLGASAADGQRTDSIILVHVPDHGGKAALISVPRDSYVPIPGHGTHKINAAYSLGGARLLTQTIEQVGDIHVDGTLEIGFAGFSDVVDSLGGVTLCPQWDMKDPEAGLDIRKGCQTMNGPTALGYVRTRHTDPRGDLGRADRQREFLGAVMKKAVNPATVLLPWRYWGFTHAAAGSVQMSSSLGMGDVVKVLSAMRGTGSGDTLSLMMPIENIGYSTPDGSAVKWNRAQASELFRMIREDTPMESAPAGTNG